MKTIPDNYDVMDAIADTSFWKLIGYALAFGVGIGFALAILH